MNEVEKLQEKYQTAVRKSKEAWGELAAAIVLSAPVKVGDVIAVGDDKDSNVRGTFQIAGIRAVDWSDQPRYEVRKRTKNGWHSVVMTVPGLSADINKGFYKLVAEG